MTIVRGSTMIMGNLLMTLNVQSPLASSLSSVNSIPRRLHEPERSLPDHAFAQEALSPDDLDQAIFDLECR
jgi:hypothetical protein